MAASPWTTPRDAQLRRLRQKVPPGLPSPRSSGTNRQAVIDRGRRIGARRRRLNSNRRRRIPVAILCRRRSTSLVGADRWTLLEGTTYPPAEALRQWPRIHQPARGRCVHDRASGGGGTALLTIPSSGYSTKLRTARSTCSAVPSRDMDGIRARGLKPPVPPAARITRMDEALAWIPLIPADRYVLRRIEWGLGR